MPAAASSGSSTSFRRSNCCVTSSRASRVTIASVSFGVMPVGPGSVMPSLICSLMPATRISKNSSRFEETIVRNRSRSSSGTDSSAACASTRRLNARMPSSRLSERHAEPRFVPVMRLMSIRIRSYIPMTPVVYAPTRRVLPCPANGAPRNPRRSRPWIQQLPSPGRAHRGRPDLPARHAPRADPARCRADCRQAARPREPGTRARGAGAVPRAAARPAAGRRARGRHECAAHRQELGRLPARGARDARFPDRGHRGTRGSAPHLSRRRARAAARGEQAPRRRHRRRLDRADRRPGPEAEADGKPLHRLRQLEPEALPGRAHRQEEPEGRGARGAPGTRRGRRGSYRRSGWQEAVGSSGTARSIEGILVENKYAPNGITRDGLDRMWDLLIDAGRADPDRIPGLKSARAPVLPGGFAIMYAIFEELDIDADDGVRGGAPPRRALRPARPRHAPRHARGDGRAVHAPLPGRCRAGRARPASSRSASTTSSPARTRPRTIRTASSSTGPRASPRSASRSRMRSTTSIRPTCSRTPTCRVSRASSSSGSRASCSRIAASSRRCGRDGLENGDWNLVFALRLASTLLRRRTRVRLPALRAIAGDARYSLELPKSWLARNALTAAALEIGGAAMGSGRPAVRRAAHVVGSGWN